MYSALTPWGSRLWLRGQARFDDPAIRLAGTRVQITMEQRLMELMAVADEDGRSYMSVDDFLRLTSGAQSAPALNIEFRRPHYETQNSPKDAKSLVEQSCSVQPVKSGFAGNICPVCLCELTTPATAPCNHHFCLECIRNWLRIHRTCPMCRTSLAEWCPIAAVQHEQAKARTMLATGEAFELQLGLNSASSRGDFKTLFVRPVGHGVPLDRVIKEVRFQLHSADKTPQKLVAYARSPPFEVQRHCSQILPDVKVQIIWKEGLSMEPLHVVLRELHADRADRYVKRLLVPLPTEAPRNHSLRRHLNVFRQAAVASMAHQRYA